MINDDNIVQSIGICYDVNNIFVPNDNTEDDQIGVAIHVYSKISHFSPLISQIKSSPKDWILSLIDQLTYVSKPVFDAESDGIS